MKGKKMTKYTILNIVIAKVWGGGEQYVYDTAKAMHQLGNKVYVVVDFRNKDMQEKFSEVATVVTSDLYGVAGLKSICILSKFIKEKGINIINCHSGHAMLLAMLLKKLTNIKLVMFKHNAMPAKFDFYHKWQRKVTDAFICVSRLVYEKQIEKLEENEKRKFHLVYNGININKFQRINKKKNNKNYVIGYAGRIAKNKGIDILLEAVEQLIKKYPKIKLVIAGSDEHKYLKKVELFIKNNGLTGNVEYVGYLNDMKTFYDKLDLFVLPSVVSEAFGLVLCEAMYCGLPVITTDSGAQKEIIDNEINGLIVQKNDVNSLIDAIERIYFDREFAIYLGKNAKKKVEENFTIKQCVINILYIYGKI